MPKKNRIYIDENKIGEIYVGYQENTLFGHKTDNPRKHLTSDLDTHGNAIPRYVSPFEAITQLATNELLLPNTFYHAGVIVSATKRVNPETADAFRRVVRRLEILVANETE